MAAPPSLGPRQLARQPSHSGVQSAPPLQLCFFPYSPILAHSTFGHPVDQGGGRCVRRRVQDIEGPVLERLHPAAVLHTGR
jgi:hypothetical protein